MFTYSGEIFAETQWSVLVLHTYIFAATCITLIKIDSNHMTV